jgi:hypothetical protein
MVAYDWQVDVSEALLLGPDCSVIARTGAGSGAAAGKTMPFVMPLFVESNKFIIINNLLYLHSMLWRRIKHASSKKWDCLQSQSTVTLTVMIFTR